MKNVRTLGILAPLVFALVFPLLFSNPAVTTIAVFTVAKKYVSVDQSVARGCYPHKRSMVSWDKAECRVTDLSQPFTYIFPEKIRRPRGDVGGNRSASPEPLYDSEFRGFSVMVG